MIQKKLNLPDNKVYNNIEKYGNTTAASIPICLSEAKGKGLISNDDLVVCAAFGAGFLWGSAIIKW
jgi:3-oxoacyl-[acyl-carrier-protein] synthase-3